MVDDNLSADVLSSFNTFSQCLAFFKQGKNDNILAYQKYQFHIVGWVGNFVHTSDIKYSRAFNFKLNSISKEETKILFAQKYSCFSDMENITQNSYVKLTNLTLRPEKGSNELYLNLATTKHSRIITLNEPRKISLPIKRKIPTPLTPHSVRKFNKPSIDVIEEPKEDDLSVSSIMNISLHSFMGIDENRRCGFSLKRILNIKDKVTFTGIIIEKEGQEGNAGRLFLKIRDMKTNDCVNIFIMYEPSVPGKVEMINELKIFNVVKFKNAYRMISKNLSIYCKISLKYSSNFEILEAHNKDCQKNNCPCHYTKELGLGMYNIKLENSIEGLPFIHTAYFAPFSFLRDISIHTLFRSIIKINAMIERVEYLVLEYICVTCKNSYDFGNDFCRSCNKFSVIFNIKAKILIEDCSSVCAEARMETLEITSKLLQLDEGKINSLKNDLDCRNTNRITIVNREFSETLTKHFINLSPKFYYLAVKPYVVHKNDTYNHDHYLSYLSEVNKDATILLNSASSDENEFPRPSLQILKVLDK